MDEPTPASMTLPLGHTGSRAPSAAASATSVLPVAANPAPVMVPPVSASAVPPPPASSSQLPGAETPDVRASALYLNRELSWLEFNARVLAEAESESVPLLERLKFHAITASNLDEFFMVPVAGLKQQLTGEVGEIQPDGMTVAEQLTAIATRVHQLVERQTENLTNNMIPQLAKAGTVIVKPEQLSPEAQTLLDQRFHSEIFPILTPIAIDPGHPFPHLRNKSLNLGVMFQREGAVEAGFGVVQVPMMLPRLFEVLGVKGPDGSPARHTFVLLEE